VAKRRSASEYALFLERIPEDTRNEIANNIKDSPVEDLNDFAYMCSGLIAEIVRGNIPPTVADAAQPYAELMYTAIVSSGKSEKTNRAAAFTTVLGRLQEAADNAKSLEAKYVVDESFEAPKEREPIPATALAE
jgi:hypothetical protein